jgi:hypothetical protein
LIKVNSQPFDKKKLITYSGYLLNPYMLPEARRFVETTVMAPYTFWTMKVQAHMGKEHPVLNMLTKQIASSIPSEIAEERAQTPFVYQLNDGITPVVSALFVPDKVMRTEDVAHEEDLSKLKDQLDVRQARVFKNIDHLTFIDGWRPLRASAAISDELNPGDTARPIFDWMLADILHATNDQNTLAKQNAPNTVPANAD